MKNANPKTLLAGNLSLWLVAALVYPVAHWVPTSSGTPPKIFDLLIPFLVLGMGFASNSLIRTALKRNRGD